MMRKEGLTDPNNVRLFSHGVVATPLQSAMGNSPQWNEMWTVPIKNPNSDGVKVIVKKKVMVGYDFVRGRETNTLPSCSLPALSPSSRLGFPHFMAPFA